MSGFGAGTDRPLCGRINRGRDWWGAVGPLLADALGIADVAYQGSSPAWADITAKYATPGTAFMMTVDCRRLEIATRRCLALKPDGFLVAARRVGVDQQLHRLGVNLCGKFHPPRNNKY